MPPPTPRPELVAVELEEPGRVFDPRLDEARGRPIRRAARTLGDITTRFPIRVTRLLFPSEPLPKKSGV